jgi:hypothetical protein
MQATHLLAVGWGLWHLPTFFENESFLAMGPVEIAGWCAGLWMGAIFLTWLYNSSQGSLIVIVVWHGLFNQFAASEASNIVPAVLTTGIIVIAIADQVRRARGTYWLVLESRPEAEASRRGISGRRMSFDLTRHGDRLRSGAKLAQDLSVDQVSAALWTTFTR